ncbi:MAG: RNA polymerase sigma factor [Deltaproteobacteria bacterium]
MEGVELQLDRDFAALTARHYDYVRARALRMCGGAADADDLAHVTFEKAQKAYDTFAVKPGASRVVQERRWLATIFKHALFDSCRRRSGRVVVPIDEVRELSMPPPEEPPFWSRFSTHHVRLAVNELSGKLRRVFVAFHFDGLSYLEIAEAEGIKVSAVGVRLKRARERLRAILEKQL